MARGLLPDHIGPLVDRLRTGDHQAVSLPDVAALTEILMRSLESYFKSIDLTIYQECQSLADYINDARLEIASLSPEHSDSAKIPRAGLELEAIVNQTESATNTIMESAERIMEADTADSEAYQGTVNDAVMQIFEACSFQDITGQRISKVVSTLENVEDRVARLINILGVMDSAHKKKAEADIEEDIDEDKALLNGPALEGEGINQTEIDALLNNEVSPQPDSQKMEPEPEPEPEPEVEVEAKVEAAPETTAPDTMEADLSGEANQDDIDSLFDEPAEVVEKSKEPNLIEQAKQKKAEALAQRKAKIKPPKPIVYEEDPAAGLDAKSSEQTTQSDIDALFS